VTRSTRRSRDTDTLIDFVRDMRTHLGADAKITLLWTRCPRGRDMTRYIASCRGWLRVERLPAYVPELNRSRVGGATSSEAMRAGRYRI